MTNQAAPGSGGSVSVPMSVPGTGPAGQQSANGDERPASAQEELEELRASLRAANAREQMLRHELQHRVRNMLAVIRSVFRRTRENSASQDQFAEHFEGRLGAIARYQSFLDTRNSVGVEIEDIVREELFSVGCSDGPMCTISGPAVLLSDKAAELIGLAVHELATNSVKFGALAYGGKLQVEWSVDGFPPESRMHLRWIETRVPVVAPAPREQGFGRQLIEEALPYQLGAETSFELQPGGLECSIILSLSNLVTVPEKAGTPAADEPSVLPYEPE